MSNITTVAFVPEGRGRGTIGVIWSCLSTWFICLWVIFHINIPGPRDSNLKRTFRQIGFIVFGALAPEYIAAIVYTQGQEAKKLQAETRNLCKTINSDTDSLVPQRTDTDAEKQARKTAPETFRSELIENWTIKHSWYCVMGGFTITPPESTKPFVVNRVQLLWLLERGHIEMPSITLDEIRDKSKLDSLLKSMAILQALWFVVQTIARVA